MIFRNLDGKRRFGNSGNILTKRNCQILHIGSDKLLSLMKMAESGEGSITYNRRALNRAPSVLGEVLIPVPPLYSAE
jgi:hypothetical protein